MRVEIDIREHCGYNRAWHPCSSGLSDQRSTQLLHCLQAPIYEWWRESSDTSVCTTQCSSLCHGYAGCRHVLQTGHMKDMQGVVFSCITYCFFQRNQTTWWLLGEHSFCVRRANVTFIKQAAARFGDAVPLILLPNSTRLHDSV